MRTHGSATVDYDAMDGLIRKRKTTREIMAALGCSKTVVNDHKRKAGLGKTIIKSTKSLHYEPREEIIPPADRLSRAVKIKQKNLEFTSAQMDWWLQGPAGRQFLGGING
jgi:hypothetical protein